MFRSFGKKKIINSWPCFFYHYRHLINILVCAYFVVLHLNKQLLKLLFFLRIFSPSSTLLIINNRILISLISYSFSNKDCNMRQEIKKKWTKNVKSQTNIQQK